MNNWMQGNPVLKKNTTISRASLVGMIAVSWISILLVGGAWLLSLCYEFREEASRLRDDHFAAQKDLVMNEARRGVELVGRIRRERIETMRHDMADRIEKAQQLSRTMGEMLAPDSPKSDLRLSVLKLLAAENDAQKLYALRGTSMYLFSPFPNGLDRKKVLDQVDTALRKSGADSGTVRLTAPAKRQECTLEVMVREVGASGMRVVSGACFEMVEQGAKEEAIRQLEAITYGMGNTMFGGTMQGDSLIGPAKGENMWDVTDVNGVFIVRELVSAANAGGGFVSYVMPPLDGSKSARKVSYVLPIEDWGWYIGTGTYVDEIEAVISWNRAQLEKGILLRGGGIAIGLFLVSILSMIAARRFSGKIRANMEAFTKAWDKVSTKGRGIETDSLHYGEFKQLAEAANRMARERLEALDALQESLDRFSNVVSNIPGIVYHSEKDEKWRNLYMSDHCLEITGYPADSFVGEGARPFYSIIHPDDQKWVRAALHDDIRAKRPYHADYRIIKKDGSIRWLSERGMLRMDEKDEPRWVDGVIFDVTDLKKAEEEYFATIHFFETLERIDRAMHETPDMDAMLANTIEVVRRTFDADRAWLLTPADPAAEDYTVPVESTVPEFPGGGAAKEAIPYDEESRDVVRVALASSAPVAFGPEADHELPHDAAQQFHVTSQLVFAIHPRVGKPWLIGLHQCGSSRGWSDNDIRLFKEVGRRLCESLSSALILHELRDSEAKFRTFSEQTMLGICVLQENKVIFANKAYADIFETTVESLKALPPGGFVKYIHPDDMDFAMEQVRKKQAGEEGVVHSYKWRAVTETGRVRWVEIHSKTTKVGGQNADLISLVDITSAKRAEEDLEAIIAERTTDLARKAEELEKANAHLRKLDELKSAFLNTVSHTMRTPLTSVIGFAKLIRKDFRTIVDTDDSSDQRYDRVLRNLEVLESEGRRLTRLVDQFMEITSLEAGSDLRTDSPHSMKECIARAAAKVRSQVEAKPNLQLVLDVAEDLPELSVSPKRFEQMLGAILDNAVAYTREGTISVIAESPDGKGLEIEIRDTGRGIPESDLEAVFNAFHQVETGDTMVDEVKGVGLGLALCRMIVERMGGMVRAQSSLGDGSSFHISLPGDNAD